jgi:hypothetical protein
LVAFLDADDEYLPGFLEHVVSVMKRYQGCAMCCTGFLIGPNRVDSKVWFGDLPVTERPWRLPTDLHPKWVKRIVDAFVPSTVVARRDILQRYGGFYAKNRCTYGEDTYLWLQVLLNHAVCRIPDALVWWHTECSELGFGRKSPVPPTPTLTDPDALWANCPPEYQSLLERYLAYTSLLTARTLIYSGRAQEAFSLLKSYPSAKVFLWEYTRVRFLDTHLIKGFHLVSRYPPLLRVYRRVKRLASAVCRCQRGKL